MTKVEQLDLLGSLLDSLKSGMLGHAMEIPEDWDGFELREWIVDYARTQIAIGSFPHNRPRRKRYLANLRDGDLLR